MSPNVLLVEGEDDQHVLWHLLEQHAVPERFKIEDGQGIDNIIRTLPVRLKGSELERLGILVDADDDPGGRWQSLRSRLQGPGSALPETLGPDGTIMTVERPDRTVTVGVWIMPDNLNPGMLETFISALIPRDDALWRRAQNTVTQIPQAERRFRPNHRVKAEVHTWLAWQEYPGTPMGSAIKFGYLDGKAEAARRLIDWIRRLFFTDAQS